VAAVGDLAIVDDDRVEPPQPAETVTTTAAIAPTVSPRIFQIVTGSFYPRASSEVIVPRQDVNGPCESSQRTSPRLGTRIPSNEA
jgi:hypothetical protein